MLNLHCKLINHLWCLINYKIKLKKKPYIAAILFQFENTQLNTHYFSINMI